MLRKLWRRYFLGIKEYKFTNIYKSAKIGRNCTIGSYTEIGENVQIGNNCKIGAYVFIPKGVVIGDNVFVGPRVCFTNDKYPKAVGEWQVVPTLVKNNSSIGANCTILCGVTVEEGAMIGAGSTITKNVPAGETWIGYAAKKGGKYEG